MPQRRDGASPGGGRPRLPPASLVVPPPPPQHGSRTPRPPHVLSARRRAFRPAPRRGGVATAPFRRVAAGRPADWREAALAPPLGRPGLAGRPGVGGGPAP